MVTMRCSPSAVTSATVIPQRVMDDAVAIRQRDPVLCNVRGVLGRIELRTHCDSICTICIYCNQAAS